MYTIFLIPRNSSRSSSRLGHCISRCGDVGAIPARDTKLSRSSSGLGHCAPPREDVGSNPARDAIMPVAATGSHAITHRITK